MRFQQRNGKFHHVLEFTQYCKNPQIKYERVSSDNPFIGLSVHCPLRELWDNQGFLQFGFNRYSSDEYKMESFTASDWCQNNCWIVSF